MDELKREEVSEENSNVNEDGSNIIPKKNIDIGKLQDENEIEELDNNKRSRLRLSILFMIICLALITLIVFQLIDIFSNLINNF